MNLKEVTYQLPIIQIYGDSSVEFENIQFDSRKIKKNDIFIAINGSISNGHNYISKAIENGATVIVCEDLPKEKMNGVTYIQVKDSAIALGKMASNFYGNPSKKIKLIGVTGTNGKTTTTTLLFELGEKLGYPCALISTINIKIHRKTIVSERTTPDILKINEILAKAVERGCEYVFMEVSSHGIDQHRIEGLEFTAAGFTNITHDHLDYHKTFNNYLSVKKSFFDNLSQNTFAITNVDDKNGSVMLQNTQAKKIGYALKTEADYKGKILESQFNGMLLQFNQQEFWTPLVGKFNAYNLLLVFAIASELGWDKDEIFIGLSKLRSVDGRFQTLTTKSGIIVIIDYAHTPDALKNVIETIQKIRTRNEKLISIVGCGGNRDKSKRPEMGDIATHLSDLAIITSDNPRNENPEDILNEIEKGIQAQNYNKYIKITDRKEAIKTAFKMANAKDIILIAGKGHETYQEINGIKHHFDDMETAIEISKILNK